MGRARKRRREKRRSRRRANPAAARPTLRAEATPPTEPEATPPTEAEEAVGGVVGPRPRRRWRALRRRLRRARWLALGLIAVVLTTWLALHLANRPSPRQDVVPAPQELPS